MLLNEYLRFKRINNNLSLNDVAKKIGCSKQNLSQIELGVISLGIKSLDKISAVYGQNSKEFILEFEEFNKGLKK